MSLPTIEETTNLGTANYQSRVQTGTTSGDTIYAITFRQEPAYLVAYDPRERRITKTHEIPMEINVDSPGSWTLTSLGDRFLYTVIRNPTKLMRFDQETESFDRLETLPDSWCRAIGCLDDQVYFSTIREPRLYEYTHETDSLRDLGRVHPTERYTHDLAIDPHTVYVGGGTSAHLSAVDRDTGHQRDILPPALDDEVAVQSVAGTPDGRLVVGTSPSMYLSVFDPEAPESARVVRPELDYTGGAITSLFATDSTVYFTTTDPSYGIWAYDLDDGDTVQRAGAPINHPTRDIFEYDDRLLGIGSGGYSAIWTLDPNTNETTSTLLGEVGLPKGPGNVQSLETMDGDVYAGGSRVTGIHHVDTGEFDIITTPGEPKVMRAVEGRLFQAIYGGAGIVAYNPETDETEELAWIGHDQNRPRTMHYHRPTGHLLIGTRPDYGCHGGAIAAYDVTADELVSVDRHVVQNQSINSLTAIEDTVYLGTEIDGGGGTDPIADTARIAAWDPDMREVLWEMAPFEDTRKIRGLTPLDGLLYGQASDERFFAVDAVTREVVVERNFGPDGDYGVDVDRDRHYREVVVGECQLERGRIYGVNFDRLFVYDPETDVLEVLLEQLGGKEAWHNFPQLAIRDDAIYVAEGKELLEVTLDG